MFTGLIEAVGELLIGRITQHVGAATDGHGDVGDPDLEARDDDDYFRRNIPLYTIRPLYILLCAGAPYSLGFYLLMLATLVTAVRWYARTDGRALLSLPRGSAAPSMLPDAG